MTRTTSGGVYDKDSDDGWLQEAGFRHKRLSAGSDVSASASSSWAAGAHAIASATVRFSSTTVTELCWHGYRPEVAACHGRAHTPGSSGSHSPFWPLGSSPGCPVAGRLRHGGRSTSPAVRPAQPLLEPVENQFKSVVELVGVAEGLLNDLLGEHLRQARVMAESPSQRSINRMTIAPVISAKLHLGSLQISTQETGPGTT